MSLVITLVLRDPILDFILKAHTMHVCPFGTTFYNFASTRPTSLVGAGPLNSLLDIVSMSHDDDDDDNDWALCRCVFIPTWYRQLSLLGDRDTAIRSFLLFRLAVCYYQYILDNQIKPNHTKPMPIVHFLSYHLTPCLMLSKLNIAHSSSSSSSIPRSQPSPLLSKLVSVASCTPHIRTRSSIRAL